MLQLSPGPLSTGTPIVRLINGTNTPETRTRVQMEDPMLRQTRVNNIRQQIEHGTYDTDQRLDAALDAFIDQGLIQDDSFDDNNGTFGRGSD